MASPKDRVQQLRRGLRKPGKSVPAPLLRSLSPQYRRSDHEQYVAILFDQLTQVGPTAPRNIALTGHYGSGKSSVLLEVQRRLNSPRRFLRRQRGKAVNIALSSLGTDEPPVSRLASNGAPPPLTNLIQKEIVKQLLYRARPARMRGSRFRRLDVFHSFEAALWSGVLAAAITAVGLLFGLRVRLEAAMPPSWLTQGPWVPWVGVGGIAVFLATVTWAAARTLHNRVRIGDASAGPVKVTLQDNADSYFDAYLDELVYFFQASRTSVVIFEDLDRFKDPHIFESLRELNTILSNAQQIRYQPLRFVYAIRDSVFESIGDESRKRRQPRPASRTTDAVAAQREISRHRTKFFDVVTPIVPFISSRNSRELVHRELKDPRISDALLDLLAPWLTDMRLLRNIANEYDVFAGQILFPAGPEGLDADHLLAMIVYKNFHLGDFEAIREGHSTLDVLYGKYRDAVTDASRTASQDAQEARAELDRLEAAPADAVALGERLKRVADAGAAPWGPSMGVVVGNTTFTKAQLTEPEFWRAWAEAQSAITFLNSGGSSVTSMSLADAELLLGVKVDADLWTAGRRAGLEAHEREALERRRRIERATFAEALQDSTAVVPRKDGPSVPLSEAAEQDLDELTLALVAAGYLLDENYALYVARFYDGRLSLQAMNFILHCIQPNRRDVHFRFRAATDIDVILREDARRLLDGEAVFNIEVFDHLLSGQTDLLLPALDRLADGSEASEQFLDTYTGAGTRVDDLIRLLAPRWPRIFTYLSSEGHLAEDIAIHLTDIAAQAASSDVVYEVSPRARGTIETLTLHGSAFISDEIPRELSALMALLGRFEILIAHLQPLAKDVRKAVIQARLYVVSAANLRTAIEGSKITLEELFDKDFAVYEHVREHLTRYLDDALTAEDFALTDQGPWRDVLDDIAGSAPAVLERVLERSTAGVRVDTLDELSTGTWGALARFGRFAATASNLADYLAARSVDGDLQAYLSQMKEIEELDLPEPDRTALAVTIANAMPLEPDRLVPLLMSLKPSELDLAELRPAVAPALPRMVVAGLIVDDAQAYEFLDGPKFRSPRRELVTLSTGFPGYLEEVDLDEQDFRALAQDPSVPDRVKTALLDGLDRYTEFLDNETARALARWSLASRVSIRLDTAILLASHGAEAATIFQLMAPQLPLLQWSDIKRLLLATGRPYDGLLEPDGRRLDLPASEGLIGILERLRDLMRVTSYQPREGGKELGVRRKVSPPPDI